MRKLILIFAAVGVIGFSTSCAKCYHCSSPTYQGDYCDNIYNSAELSYYQNVCVNDGGNWTQN